MVTQNIMKHPPCLKLSDRLGGGPVGKYSRNQLTIEECVMLTRNLYVENSCGDLNYYGTSLTSELVGDMQELQHGKKKSEGLLEY